MLGAAAGVFVVVGVVAFIVEVDSNDPTRPGVRPHLLVLVAAALVAGLLVVPARSGRPASPRSCSSVPLVWFFAFFGGGNASRDDLRLVYLLTLRVRISVLYLAEVDQGPGDSSWPARCLFFASWIDVRGCRERQQQPHSRSRSEIEHVRSRSGNFAGQQLRRSEPTDTTDSTAAAALVIGSCSSAWARCSTAQASTARPRRSSRSARSRRSSARSCSAATRACSLAGLLAIGAGAVVGIVGRRGDRRRATTWIGVLVVFGGSVAVLVDIAPEQRGGVGGIALGFALGARASIAWWLAPVLGEPDDGDDMPVPPTRRHPTAHRRLRERATASSRLGVGNRRRSLAWL